MIQRGIIVLLLLLITLVSACTTEEQPKPEKPKKKVEASAVTPVPVPIAPKTEEKAPEPPPVFVDDKTTTLPSTTLEEVADPRRKKLQKLIRSVVGKDGTIEIEGKTHPAHCSGMVRAIYGTVGIDLYYKSRDYSRYEGAVRVIHGSFKEHQWTDKTKLPKAGDLVFFNNTWDQDHNGEWDDPLTHVALVEGVEKDSRTITIIHSVNSGIQRYRINLDNPTLYMKDGKKFNDFLRRRPPTDQDRTKYFAAVLFHSYIDLLGPAK